ncbi:MAG: AIR synthase-related protein, partial [Flavobacteriales bacterium]|nr:AIR synthase-related protein [Flavobacteriales bacterium]
HVSNGRALIDDDDNDFWFGFEQEYFIMDSQTLLPLGFPIGGYPAPQGLYYCSVGGRNTHGRDLVERHAAIRSIHNSTGGNVSFYNQSAIDGVEVPVFPTPTIGMLGIIEDKKHITSLAFKGKSDLIYMIGESKNDISSSEYLASYHNIKQSPAPCFDLDKEYDVQNTITKLIRDGVIESAHDVSDGGLFITLLESSFTNDLGFEIVTSSEVREDAFLFGESPSRVIVSVTETGEDAFLDLLKDLNTPFVLLGHVTKGRISIDSSDFGDICEYKKIYNESLARKLS